MFNFTSLPPLALYIHFPWCVQKCPYCDFNSHELKSALEEKNYIDALIRDRTGVTLVLGQKHQQYFYGRRYAKFIQS